MGHPRGDTNWAANAAFASPGDSWDTDPTKVEPSAGRKAEGWEPTQVPPAEFLNWWKNAVGLYIDFLRLIGVKAWETLPGPPGTDLNDVATDPSTGTIIACGDAGETRLSKDNGATWAAPAGAGPGATTLFSIDSDGAGGFVIGSASAPNIYHSGDDGTNWATVVFGAGFDAVDTVRYESVSALWVLFADDGTTERIFTSPDRVVWTLRSNTLSSGNGRRGAVGGGRAAYLVDNADILISGDMITWSLVTPTGTPALAVWGDVVYSPGAGIWMAIGSDAAGDLYVATSTDGIAWTTTGGVPPVGSDGQLIETDGGELFIVQDIQDQLHVTVDRGLTWTTLTPSDVRELINPSASDGIKHLRRFYSRFWAATEGGDIFRTSVAI